MDEYCCRQKDESPKFQIDGSLQSATVSGLGWSCLSQVVQQTIQFIVTAILAHLLVPADFGMMAMIVIFIGFLRSVADLGFTVALIQKHEIDHRHLNTVFWLTIASGILLTLLSIFLAPFIAKFYGQHCLKNLTIALSVIFIVTSLSVVPQAILQKGMKFRLLAKVETGAAIVAGVCAVVLASRGAGIWSLVMQTLVGASASTLLLWYLCRWRPAFTFDSASCSEMYRFSANLMGFNVLNYWVRNLDNLLVGRFLGSSMLGIYSFAYNLMVMPVSQITGVTSRVMFPALASIKDDIDRVRGIYLMSTRIIALFSFPVIVGMIVVAEPFIMLVYGAKWLPVVPVFQILCLTGLLQPVGATVGWIFTTQGRTDLMFKFGVYAGIIYLISFAVGIKWGIIGVAWSYFFSSYLLILYPSWSIPGRLIRISFARMIVNLLAPFLASATMGCLVWGVDAIFLSKRNAGFRISILVLTGVFVFSAILYIFQIRAFGEAKNFLLELRRLLKPQNSSST
jgi:O-antigen/teichoic acid export membrane protein